jgi:Na+:H+ antiporter, NhaA family
MSNNKMKYVPIQKDEIPDNLVNDFLKPLQKFVNLQALSGIVLFFFSAVALFLSNSRWFEQYEHLLHTEIGFVIGNLEVFYSLHHWINEGLMTVFFLL